MAANKLHDGAFIAPRDAETPCDVSWGSGPESGGGPPPTSPASPEQEKFEDKQALELPVPLDRAIPARLHFSSVVDEPYETVFADPSPQARTPVSELSPGGFCLDGGKNQEQDMLIRNLDTGEIRRLGEGALTKSFLKGECSHPQDLAVGHKSPWSRWWATKHGKDEQLWLAAGSSCIASLRQALESPEDASEPRLSVNSRSLYGKTALHIAASVGIPESIEQLLDAGADHEACTDAGLTALHISSQRGHLGVVTLLLAWGAEVSPEAHDGNLPLHLASMNGHSEVVRLLLKRGDNEQLVMRNRTGQRASEVSMDLATVHAFKAYEDKISSTSLASEHSPSPDKYAGRTPLHNNTDVLLRNARADAVFRLLKRTQNLPDLNWGPSIVVPDGGQKSKNGREKGRARAPFAQLRDGPDAEKVGPDSFELMNELGAGSFGEVFKVKHKQTGLVYAMKILRKSKVMSGNSLRYAVTERNVLSYIRHPYMVSLHYAFQTRSYLVLVMEYCPGGNLQQLIQRETRLQAPLAQLYTAELLLAFIHLHARQIVFRDLKPENVVRDALGHAMLTDFGLSKEGVNALNGTRSFCGSVAFLAPEILQRRGHNHTVDIYGLGVLLFDMLTGLPPFYHSERDRLYHNIKHATLKVPPYVTPSTTSFIHALMKREPSQRLGAADTSDVKSHPYFDNMDFEALMRREVPLPQSLSARHDVASSAQPLRPRPENPFKGYGVAHSDVSGWSFSATPPPSA